MAKKSFDVAPASTGSFRAIHLYQLHQSRAQPRAGRSARCSDSKEMEKVYTQRMAKTGAPGRYVYDEIFASSPHGRCPLCAQRSVATLDHHLPKAHFPALAVAPLNLVSACSDCNKAKLSSVPTRAEDVSLHPYYDDLGDQVWLAAEVVEKRPTALRFYVVEPAVWDPVLAARVRKHFRSLGLAALYASQSAEELVNIRYQLTTLRASDPAAGVRDELARRAKSCAVGRPNGWRAAAYRAWQASLNQGGSFLKTGHKRRPNASVVMVGRPTL